MLRDLRDSCCLSLTVSTKLPAGIIATHHNTPPLAPQVGSGSLPPNGGPDASPAKEEGFVMATFDLDEIRTARAG